VYCIAVSCAAKSVENIKVVDLVHIKIAVKVSLAIYMRHVNLHYQLLNVAEFFYILCLMLLKISLGIFFLRLTFTRVQHVIIYAAVTTSLIFSFAMFLFAVFQCGYYHNIGEFIFRRLSDKCASNSTALGISYTHSTVVVLTDWTFILLPVFIFRGTLKTWHQKITFSLFMSFVAIAGIAAIVRMSYLKPLAIPKREFLGKMQLQKRPSSLNCACYKLRVMMLTDCSPSQGRCRLVRH
jgi:hypothetical protein